MTEGPDPDAELREQLADLAGSIIVPTHGAQRAIDFTRAIAVDDPTRRIRTIAIPVLGLVAALLVLGVIDLVIGRPHDAWHARFPPTQVSVVRPVTSGGVPASGFVLSGDRASAVDCGTGSSALPSPGAVDSGVLHCFPSASGANACWRAPVVNEVICLPDVWGRKLLRFTDRGTPSVGVAANPSPLGLVLDDGDRCSLRNGGAWNSLRGRPDWNATYGCRRDGAVWAPGGSDGIDRTMRAWTVQTGPLSGTGPLRQHHVRHAYFVGDAHAPSSPLSTDSGYRVQHAALHPRYRESVD